MDKPAAQPEFRKSDIDRRENLVVLEAVQRMESKLDTVTGELRRHIQEEANDIANDIAKEIAKLMKEAFPEGDPDGHRKHHELVIAREEARAEFWRKMLFELSRVGLLGFLGWLGVLAWKALLLGPKQ